MVEIGGKAASQQVSFRPAAFGNGSQLTAPFSDSVNGHSVSDLIKRHTSEFPQYIGRPHLMIPSTHLAISYSLNLKIAKTHVVKG